MPFDNITNDDARDTNPRLDFRDPANRAQDFESIVEAFGDMAAHKWGKQATSGGFHNDAQIANASQCALRAALEGFYMKKPRTTHWADGSMIQITDRGAHPGDEEIEYATAGARYSGDNDGITHDDLSPETSIEIAEDLTVQRFVMIKHKIHLTWKQLQKANKRGFSEFDRKGTALRNQHMFDFNNVIRRGNKKAKITGICNHPGIRRLTATFDWGADAPADIYDEFNAAINAMYASPTEEDVPQYCLLPRRQYNYFATTQFSVAGDTKLKQFIETAYADEAIPLKIKPDNGLTKSGPFDGPCALFYTNNPDIARVTAPMYMRLLEPYDESRYAISVEIVSMIAGVQLLDVDTVLVLDGEAAGWEAPPDDETYY